MPSPRTGRHKTTGAFDTREELVETIFFKRSRGLPLKTIAYDVKVCEKTVRNILKNRG